MSDTTQSPQQGAGTTPSGKQPGPQQQGQTPQPKPQQQQSGPVIRDWASI